jgi:hypothetical protein
MARGTILVVEDHPLNRELIVDLLKGAGYMVLEAENGHGLVERVQVERPDLILLDLQLPGENGFSLAHRLSTDPATRTIPIVSMSAYARPEEQARAVAAGCVDVLAKPIDIDTVLATIARCLRR